NQHVVYLNAFNWYSLGAAGLTSLQQSVQEVDAALAK
ncbi:iron ABC transporter substrate-binding protein, partial [Bordetella hinzii]|nr:iron ABC transporter substrate-binding protein [Bordetella hinzii]